MDIAVFKALKSETAKILSSSNGLVICHSTHYHTIPYFDALTHYQTTNFRLFQTEEFADDNFKFDENGIKLSKRVENTVGKGEIAGYEQFLLFHSVFKRLVY